MNKDGMDLKLGKFYDCALGSIGGFCIEFDISLTFE